MEEALDGFRSSTGRWLVGTFEGWACLAVTIGGLALTSYFDNRLFLVLSAAGVVYVVVKWLKYLAASYEITTQRLIVRRGIIFKSIDEIELYRVKDVKVAFSILNQLFDIGRIAIVSSDRTHIGAPLILPDVPKARSRREKLRDLVQAERVRRGVREIDYEPEAF